MPPQTTATSVVVAVLKQKHPRPKNPHRGVFHDFDFRLFCYDGLIVIPTDTIYAFAVSIKSKKAIRRLASIKNVKTHAALKSLPKYRSLKY